MFALDARTGELLWRLDTESPAWANPSVGGNRVYFGLGHGRMNESHERPGGALLCVQAETGSQLWRYPLEDAVLAQPVVEGRYVYFGSRDKHLYCLDRKDGKLAWKYPLGSPMVAAPLVARCQFCGARSSIFAVASAEHGQAKLFCLGPNTGRLYWSIDVAALASAPVELFSSPALTIERTPDGERRRIYFGATALSAARTALLYCFEDRIESEKDQD